MATSHIDFSDPTIDWENALPPHLIRSSSPVPVRPSMFYNFPYPENAPRSNVQTLVRHENRLITGAVNSNFSQGSSQDHVQPHVVGGIDVGYSRRLLVQEQERQHYREFFERPSLTVDTRCVNSSHPIAEAGIQRSHANRRDTRRAAVNLGPVRSELAAVSTTSVAPEGTSETINTANYVQSGVSQNGPPVNEYETRVSATVERVSSDTESGTLPVSRTSFPPSRPFPLIPSSLAGGGGTVTPRRHVQPQNRGNTHESIFGNSAVQQRINRVSNTRGASVETDGVIIGQRSVILSDVSAPTVAQFRRADSDQQTGRDRSEIRWLVPPATRPAPHFPASEDANEWEIHDWSYESLLQLNAMNVNIGLNIGQLCALSPQKISGDGDVVADHKLVEMCTICLEIPSANSEILTLPCNHTFHYKCIILWLAKNNKCPVCRFEIQKTKHI